MGLICNLFSTTNKVLNDLCKYSLPMKNHNFWVNLTKDYNYSWKYKLVVMSIDLYMSLYWCTRSCRDTFGNRLYFWELRNSKTKAGLLYNNLIYMRSPDIPTTQWFIYIGSTFVKLLAPSHLPWETVERANSHFNDS